MENIFLENLKTDKEKLNKVAEIFTRFRTGSQVVLSDITHLKRHYTELNFDNLDQDKIYYVVETAGRRGAKGTQTINELDLNHWSKFINANCEEIDIDNFAKVNNVFSLQEGWFLFKF